jgi:YfiH family protein
LAEQVHGTRIGWIGKRAPVDFVRRTDGLFTREPGVALGVFTADCVPVLFAWPAEGIVGVVHAGWRGLAAGIIRKACRGLLRRSGRKTLRGLRVAIGPHIRSCCYEVSRDVARAFPQSTVARGTDSRWYVSLSGEARRQLTEEGLDAGALSEAPFCTKDDRRFFSHRRDQDSRRILAYIVRQ